MKIGLIGFGNIGQGVEELIFKQKAKIKKRFGEEISVQSILVRNVTKARLAFDKTAIFTDKFDDLIYNPEIDALVEVTGAVDEAYDYLSRGLKAGKHVITANKAVVSKYFEELSQLAVDNNKAFLYEASVGGGVHIIKSIIEDAHLNNISYVRGILNGTCNYILSKIEDEDVEYEKVLKEAQKLGYAEPDPSADVDGLDTLRKTRILSSLIMGGKVREEDISCFGISNIGHDDLQIMKELNASVKLIGEGAVKDGKYYATVMPTFLPKSDIFSQIKSSTNLISYEGNNIGQVSFVGAGAGRYPTADAILRDLVDAMVGSYIPGNPISNEEITISNYDMEGYFYIRLNRKYEDIFDGLYEEKTDLFDKVFILTKKIKFGIILDLVKNLKKKDFFLARILKEDDQ